MNAAIINILTALGAAFATEPKQEKTLAADLRTASRQAAWMRRGREPERCGTALVTVSESRPQLEDFDGDY